MSCLEVYLSCQSLSIMKLTGACDSATERRGLPFRRATEIDDGLPVAYNTDGLRIGWTTFRYLRSMTVSHKRRHEGRLGQHRFIEAADTKGVYRGKPLAELAADGVGVERLGGDDIRSTPSLAPYGSYPEKRFCASCCYRRVALKRRDTLENHTRPANYSDAATEWIAARHLGNLGVACVNPFKTGNLCGMSSTTGFGCTGPSRHYKATQFIGFATGPIPRCGEPRPRPRASRVTKGIAGYPGVPARFSRPAGIGARPALGREYVECVSGQVLGTVQECVVQPEEARVLE